MDPLFDGWDRVLSVLVTAPLLYATVVLFVRVSGKRSTSKMNTFDWIVTVAIGSIVGSGVVSSSVSLATAATAVGVLLLLQLVITKAASYSPGFHAVVTGSPTLVYFRGEFQEKAMHAERVARAEILTAAREAGHATMAAVEAVILESDGQLSVLGQTDAPALTALDGVTAVPAGVPTQPPA